MLLTALSFTGTTSYADWTVTMAAERVAVLLELLCWSLGRPMHVRDSCLWHVCGHVQVLSTAPETDTENIFVPIKSILAVGYVRGSTGPGSLLC